MSKTIVVAQRMWQRRDSAANWQSVNPVLAAGEIGVELGATPEETQFKIGTGAHPWNDLPYFSGGGGSAPVEMRVSEGFIQYRSADDAEWSNLIPVSDLVGPKGDDGTDGREIELRATASFVQWRYVGGATWMDLLAISDLVGPPGPASSAYLGAAFDGGAGVVQVGAFADVRVPYGFEITKVSILASPAGSITIDVLNCLFADAPPQGVDTICGGNPPTLTSGQAIEDAALDGWRTSINTGSVFRFVVLASSGVRKANILIEGIRV